MKARTFLATLFLLAVGASAMDAVAGTYSATLLHPAGYFESAVYDIDTSGSAQVGWVSSTPNQPHAALWAGTPSSLVDLHKGTFQYSTASAVSGGIQGGTGDVPFGMSFRSHAMIWSGNAASAIDLHPSGFLESHVLGNDGATQVGYGDIPFSHALLWHGTAASVVDLNPAGFELSSASAVFGSTEVGYARTTHFSNGFNHAMIWNGTAASAIDLNPSNYSNSTARDIYGTKQVGDANTGSLVTNHAMLWSGTAASAIDLHPAGFTSSEALSTIEDFQVGYAIGADGINHAILWNGTAASAIDLNPLFTALNPTLVGSQATGIAANGSIVGNAYDASGNTYAVLLTVVPEPSTAILALGIFAPLAAYRRRRN